MLYIQTTAVKVYNMTKQKRRAKRFTVTNSVLLKCGKMILGEIIIAGYITGTCSCRPRPTAIIGNLTLN